MIFKNHRNPFMLTETVANGYSSDSTQRELSNEYQHDRVKMIFISFCFFVHWTKFSLSSRRVNLMCRMSASELQYICTLTPLELALVRYVQYGYIIGTGMKSVLSTFHGISSFLKQVHVDVRIANTLSNCLISNRLHFKIK